MTKVLFLIPNLAHGGAEKSFWLISPIIWIKQNLM